jgi:hypothetical protein
MHINQKWTGLFLDQLAAGEFDLHFTYCEYSSYSNNIYQEHFRLPVCFCSSLGESLVHFLQVQQASFHSSFTGEWGLFDRRDTPKQSKLLLSGDNKSIISIDLRRVGFFVSAVRYRRRWLLEIPDDENDGGISVYHHIRAHIICSKAIVLPCMCGLSGACFFTHVSTFFLLI